MIVRLRNGAAFVVERVECWDWTYNPDPHINDSHLRIFLQGGGKFEVHHHDYPNPQAVERWLIEKFGPIATGVE